LTIYQLLFGCLILSYIIINK